MDMLSITEAVITGLRHADWESHTAFIPLSVLYLDLSARATDCLGCALGHLGSLGVHRQGLGVVGTLDLGVVHRAHDPGALKQVSQHLRIVPACASLCSLLTGRR